MVNTQVCACHTGPFAGCDYPGGCGSSRGCCCSTRPAQTCITCPTYRPDSAPRTPNYPPVCDADRALLDRHLADIGHLITDLTAGEPQLIDQRRYERFIIKHGQTVSLGHAWADPLAAVGGVAHIPSKPKHPNVTGSRERSIPINVTVMDLNAPAKTPSLAASPRGSGDTTHRGWPEDQIGHLAAATTLDQWVRDWRDTLWPDHTLPAATVHDLTTWLRNRVNEACDRHPAIAEFTDEIRALRSALRGVAGETEPRPERCDGIPCKRCDQMFLFRQPDGDVHCINMDCQAVLRPDEYTEWAKTLAAEVKIRRNTDVAA